MSIEVVNLSPFPVTVTEIGFTIGPGRGSLPKRVLIQSDALISGQTLPARLEKHGSLSQMFDVGFMADLDVRHAYALTNTGKIVRGNSGALKQFIARGRKPI